MAVNIPVQIYAQEILNERLKSLKSKKFPNPHQSTNTTNFAFDFAFFHQPLANDDVIGFVDMLEHMSTNKQLPLLTIFSQKSPSGNSLLHEAASFGSTKITKFIVDHFPFLLTKKNILGDSAIHVATKNKHLKVLEVLINSSTVELQMRNSIGNTALHEAMFFPICYEAINLLFWGDPNVAYILNEDGKSPLCLATHDKQIVGLLSLAPYGNRGLIGRSRLELPFYDAIRMERLDILEEVFNKNPLLFHVRDQKGKTPLHLAVANNYIEGIQFILTKFRQHALVKSLKGDLPIHISSKKGHIKVVEIFLEQQWHDPSKLLNSLGQNILHVAAKHGQDKLVKIILSNPRLEKLLNERDKNGHTALHLASMNFHSNVVCTLMWDRRVNLNQLNKKGLTASDIVRQNERTTRQILTDLALATAAGTPMSIKGSKILSRKPRTRSRYRMIKHWFDILLMISILVATVAFTAGLTVPGGLDNSSDDRTKGMAILANEWAFQAFSPPLALP
ncbi:protein ACCELERATED CELL DEATH 6-like [Quercus lobata]|uniref:protein ACCELERATED CELL DEATH 6-like n=1 Tax=Quercus lobata TaxID=97700 RepID=UPI0012486980|nr:protein ACCELERATED CELL DEATH 6-like [Quercus lobata]